MDATAKNYEIVEKIIAILEAERCTVRQSEDVLRYAASEIRERSTVRVAKK